MQVKAGQFRQPVDIPSHVYKIISVEGDKVKATMAPDYNDQAPLDYDLSRIEKMQVIDYSDPTKAQIRKNIEEFMEKEWPGRTIHRIADYGSDGPFGHWYQVYFTSGEQYQVKVSGAWAEPRGLVKSADANPTASEWFMLGMIEKQLELTEGKRKEELTPEDYYKVIDQMVAEIGCGGQIKLSNVVVKKFAYLKAEKRALKTKDVLKNTLISAKQW